MSDIFTFHCTVVYVTYKGDNEHTEHKSYKIKHTEQNKMETWTHQRWTQVSRSSENPPLTDHTRRDPSIFTQEVDRSRNQYLETELANGMNQHETVEISVISIYLF